MKFHLDANILVTSTLLTASSSRRTYISGDSSFSIGRGITTDLRTRSEDVVRGDEGREVGEEERNDGGEKTFRDKRCNRGGFV